MSNPYIPPRYIIKLKAEQIAYSLGLTVEQVMKEFRDARVISRFSEYWAGQLYGYEKVSNTNNASYDGTIKNKLIGTQYISIKSLTNSGIRFQQSKYIGSGRTCNKELLLKSLDDVDFIIIVDIINFPQIKFIPVPSSTIIGLINNDSLTHNGYRENSFYSNIFKMAPNDVVFEYYELYK